MRDIDYKKIRDMVIEFSAHLQKKYPRVVPCPSVGIGFLADNKDCRACSKLFPEYKEACRKFTKQMSDLQSGKRGL